MIGKEDIIICQWYINMGYIGKLGKVVQKYYYFYIKRDRVAYARKLGVRIGEHCQLLVDPQKTFSSEPWLIKLGNHVRVTKGVLFLTHEGAIWCARGLDDKYREIDSFSPITVGNNVMIGVNSLIMPGVNIGNNVIVGSHSVVTKDIPDGAIVAGVPAKQISTIDKFMETIEDRNLVPTKHMTQGQKKEYLEKHFPEWFD